MLHQDLPVGVIRKYKWNFRWENLLVASPEGCPVPGISAGKSFRHRTGFFKASTDSTVLHIHSGAPPPRPEPFEFLEPWLLELNLEFLRPLPLFFSFFLWFFSFLPPVLARAPEPPGAGAAGWPLWRKLHLSPRLQTRCLKNLHSCLLPLPFPLGLGVLVGVRPPLGVRDLPLGI